MGMVLCIVDNGGTVPAHLFVVPPPNDVQLETAVTSRRLTTTQPVDVVRIARHFFGNDLVRDQSQTMVGTWPLSYQRMGDRSHMGGGRMGHAPQMEEVEGSIKGTTLQKHICGTQRLTFP